MGQRRILHERDAYGREPRGTTKLAYKFEGDVFHGMYPPFYADGRSAITKERGEELIEKTYARFAPTRKRPRFKLMLYRNAFKNSKTGASYTVATHTIWAPVGGIDEQMMIHEIAHSLTWRQGWVGHGPEFMRMLIELHCWHLKMNVAERLKLCAVHDVPVTAKLVFGHDPTNVDWIRTPRKRCACFRTLRN